LYVGLDLSRKRVDVCALREDGELVLETAVAPDADALRTLVGTVARVDPQPVSAAIESMTGARFVHDTLERYGWEVELADAQRAKALAPLAAKTDRIDARVLAELGRHELVPAI
jgi:transposase